MLTIVGGPSSSQHLKCQYLCSFPRPWSWGGGEIREAHSVHCTGHIFIERGGWLVGNRYVSHLQQPPSPPHPPPPVSACIAGGKAAGRPKCEGLSPICTYIYIFYLNGVKKKVTDILACIYNVVTASFTHFVLGCAGFAYTFFSLQSKKKSPIFRLVLL